MKKFVIYLVFTFFIQNVLKTKKYISYIITKICIKENDINKEIRIINSANEKEI